MTLLTYTRVFNMGYKSAQAGEPTTANPYAEHRTASHAWVRGWHANTPGMFCRKCGERLYVRGICTIYCRNENCGTCVPKFNPTELESEQCEHTESPCFELEKRPPASPYTTWAK